MFNDLGLGRPMRRGRPKVGMYRFLSRAPRGDLGTAMRDKKRRANSELSRTDRSSRTQSSDAQSKSLVKQRLGYGGSNDDSPCEATLSAGTLESSNGDSATTRQQEWVDVKAGVRRPGTASCAP